MVRNEAVKKEMETRLSKKRAVRMGHSVDIVRRKQKDQGLSRQGRSKGRGKWIEAGVVVRFLSATLEE